MKKAPPTSAVRDGGALGPVRPDPRPRVLIVDDNPEKTLALQSVLDELECRTVVASSAEAGLRELLKRDFALAVLDIHMPGMDGFELARLIRSRPAHRDMAIMFMSAIDQTDERLENAYALGAIDFISLPARRPLIKAKLAAILGLQHKARNLEIVADESARKLRVTEERFRLLLAKAEDIAIFFIDVSGVVVEWSHAAELRTGWSADEIVGRSYSVLFVPGDIADHVPTEKMADAAAGYQEVNERWLVRKDGSRFRARFSLVALQEKGASDYGVLMRDITAQHQAEQELHIKAEVLESIAESVCVLDETLRIVYANTAAQRMFGYAAEELAGKDFKLLNDLGSQEQEAQIARLMAHFSHSRSWEGEWRNRRKNGDRFLTQTRLSTFDHDGQKYFVSVQEDLTQRQQAEAALQQGRELQEVVHHLEAFAYSISHDIKAPLRSVRGFAEAVVNDYGEALKGPGLEYMDRIRSAVARLEKMVEDTLAFSRIPRTALALEPVELGRLVSDLIEETPAFRLPHAEVRIQGVLPSVLGHESSLRQVFFNLLSNGVKFVMRGQRPVVVIRAERCEPEVTVWVEDNGIGIRPADQGRIFEAFERANPESAFPGSGIGLAIVRRTVERIGGPVGVVSELGRGSRFWVKLRTAGPTEMPGRPRGPSRTGDEA